MALTFGLPEPKAASLGLKTVSELLREIQDMERALNTLGFSLQTPSTASGTFTTADSKTVTVVNGIITNIA